MAAPPGLPSACIYAGSESSTQPLLAILVISWLSPISCVQVLAALFVCHYVQVTACRTYCPLRDESSSSATSGKRPLHMRRLRQRAPSQPPHMRSLWDTAAGENGHHMWGVPASTCLSSVATPHGALQANGCIRQRAATREHHRQMAALDKGQPCALLSLPVGLAVHRGTQSSQSKETNSPFTPLKQFLESTLGPENCRLPPLQGHNDPQASSGLTALCGLSTAAPHTLALHHVPSQGHSTFPCLPHDCPDASITSELVVNHPCPGTAPRKFAVWNWKWRNKLWRYTLLLEAKPTAAAIMEKHNSHVIGEGKLCCGF